MEANKANKAHLRRVLNLIFPTNYIQLYHKTPNSICSLLNISSWPNQHQTSKKEDNIYEASSEPVSRASLISLRENLNSSLVEHEAKSVGLCPIRRAIYDQCFDELIRQVTVGCIEQGLLLFRVRNELRMTINYFRKAYQAGIDFGLRKAIDVEVELEKSRSQISELEKAQDSLECDFQFKNRINEVQLRNKLESVDKLSEYYKSELAKRDQIIEQQRAIIRALSQKFTSEIKSPI